jgi:hypothetical protein
MKKKIALLLIMAALGSSSLWAVNVKTASIGISAMGLGAVCIAAPLTFGFGAETAIPLYITGGLVGAFGIFALVTGLIEKNPEYAQLQEDPILRLVSFGTNGKETYIGARFKF